MAVSIIPDTSHSYAEKARLEDFKAGSESLDYFEEILEAAGKAIASDQNSKIFSNDVLRVRLTGPKLPYLTLVDLPSLLNVGNGSQSAAGVEAVEKLANTYMSKSRSIILAVASARNDYAIQTITKHARHVDPDGKRTLGIITKPEILRAGSENEKRFFELAQNKDIVLRLGWHVLNKPGLNTEGYSAKERDQAEENFFSNRIWRSMRPTHVGVSSLQSRLSRVLKDQILAELPSLITEVEAGIADCERRLERLDSLHATKTQQRAHLHTASQNFCKLIRNAVSSLYQEGYFGGNSDEISYVERIRAVYNYLDKFEAEMSSSGHKYRVVGRLPDQPQSKGYPILITRTARLDSIQQMIKLNRGPELPGFSMREIIIILFKEQCTLWSGIVNKYAQKIFNAVRAALCTVPDTTADKTTSDGIRRFIINPVLEEIKIELDLAVEQNLDEHVSDQPITFEQYFRENMQKLHEQHRVAHLQEHVATYFGGDVSLGKYVGPPFKIEDLAQQLALSTKEDSLTFTCSAALYYMEAFYEVFLIPS